MSGPDDLAKARSEVARLEAFYKPWCSAAGSVSRVEKHNVTGATPDDYHATELEAYKALLRKVAAGQPLSPSFDRDETKLEAAQFPAPQSEPNPIVKRVSLNVDEKILKEAAKRYNAALAEQKAQADHDLNNVRTEHEAQLAAKDKRIDKLKRYHNSVETRLNLQIAELEGQLDDARRDGAR